MRWQMQLLDVKGSTAGPGWSPGYLIACSQQMCKGSAPAHSPKKQFVLMPRENAQGPL